MTKEIIEYCNKCKKHTPHNVKANNLEVDSHQEEHHYIEFGRKLFQILECTICKETFGRTRQREQSPYTYPLTGVKFHVYHYSEKYHPPRLVNTLCEKINESLPLMTKKAYEEIIYCYNHDKLIICSAGIKTLVEWICMDFKILKESVKKSIGEIARNELNMSELDSINYLVEFDHITFENLHDTNRAELRIVIELLEDLMFKLYPPPPNSGS